MNIYIVRDGKRQIPRGLLPLFRDPNFFFCGDGTCPQKTAGKILSEHGFPRPTDGPPIGARNK